MYGSTYLPVRLVQYVWQYIPDSVVWHSTFDNTYLTVRLVFKGRNFLDGNFFIFKRILNYRKPFMDEFN